MDKNKERGVNDMDQLYTVDELMGFLKVSRATLYDLMANNVIPYVQVQGKRRFIGGQVMGALKRMQVQQVQSKVRGEKGLVLNDTLSDVVKGLHHVNTCSTKALKKLKKQPYNLRASKTVKRSRAK